MLHNGECTDGLQVKNSQRSRNIDTAILRKQCRPWTCAIDTDTGAPEVRDCRRAQLRYPNIFVTVWLILKLSPRLNKHRRVNYTPTGDVCAGNYNTGDNGDTIFGVSWLDGPQCLSILWVAATTPLAYRKHCKARRQLFVCVNVADVSRSAANGSVHAIHRRPRLSVPLFRLRRVKQYEMRHRSSRFFAASGQK